MMPAVAGGGVPVGAYNAIGMKPLFHAEGGATPTLAHWAADTPSVKPHTACQEHTKKGERCSMPRIADADGAMTLMCVGHWNGVVAYVKKLEADAAKAEAAEKKLEAGNV